MDKYQAVTIINFLQLIFILAVIFMAGYFNNYLFFLLLLLASIENLERRILESNGKKNTRRTN